MSDKKANSFYQALYPRDIGLILSYRCFSNCAHCLYNCGPDWHDWMREEEIRIALENAKGVWGEGFQVHLTGGEPFLNFPLLLKATQIAQELAIPVYVETNAGWVKRFNTAADRFQQLRDAGLSAVLVSVSPFHQETIPLSRTLEGIAAARAVFGADRVIIFQSQWLPEMTRRGLEKPVQIEEYIREYGVYEGGLRLWMGYGLISGGRAGYRLGDWVDKRPMEAFKSESCYEELLYAPHSHLDLYGNFIPSFCGGITLGNWHGLQGLVDGYHSKEAPHFIQILINRGPYGLFLEEAKKYGYQPLEGGYAGKCHLCVDLRRFFVKRSRFLEFLKPPGFYALSSDGLPD